MPVLPMIGLMAWTYSARIPRCSSGMGPADLGEMRENAMPAEFDHFSSDKLVITDQYGRP